MKNKKQTGLKSESGFTIIELTIVIAIMGILSAILVPSLTTMARKAKIKADISTIKNVQAQIELYEIENDGELPGGGDDYGGLIENSQLSEEVVTALVQGGYIKKTDTEGSGEKVLRFQSKKVELGYTPGDDNLKLVFKGVSEAEEEYIKNMSESDSNWVASVDKK